MGDRSGQVCSIVVVILIIFAGFSFLEGLYNSYLENKSYKGEFFKNDSISVQSISTIEKGQTVTFRVMKGSGYIDEINVYNGSDFIYDEVIFHEEYNNTLPSRRYSGSYIDDKEIVNITIPKNLTKNEIYFEVICSDPVPGPRGGEFHYENFIRTIRVEF